MGDVIMVNLGKQVTNGVTKVFVPVVFGVAAHAAVGVAIYAAKKIEFPEDGIVDKQIGKIRKFFCNTPNGLKKEKRIFQERINTAKRNFEFYKSKHERLLKEIQELIKDINENKIIIKKGMLQKLVDTLIKIGIESEVKDYHYEVLDYRRFLISEKFNIVKKEQDKLDKLGIEISDDLFVFVPIIAIGKYFHNLKELNTESDNFKEKSNFILNEMKADLNRIEILQAALRNISGIFRDLKERYEPLIENFIEDIIKKYSSCENIPEERLILIRNITYILKDICERKIVNCADVEEVKKYSDYLTEKYLNIRNLLPIQAA